MGKIEVLALVPIKLDTELGLAQPKLVYYLFISSYYACLYHCTVSFEIANDCDVFNKLVIGRKGNIWTSFNISSLQAVFNLHQNKSSTLLYYQ